MLNLVKLNLFLLIFYIFLATESLAANSIIPKPKPLVDTETKIKSAKKKDIHTLASFCIKNLEKRNFFKPGEKKPIMLENLRSIFYKMELSEKETRILSSVFASLAKK